RILHGGGCGPERLPGPGLATSRVRSSWNSPRSSNGDSQNKKTAPSAILRGDRLDGPFPGPSGKVRTPAPDPATRFADRPTGPRPPTGRGVGLHRVTVRDDRATLA